MQLTQIIYTSRIDPQLALSAQTLSNALAEIHRISQRNNARCDVSGLLLYSKGHFLQVLEGRATTLERIYQKIAADPRHSDIESLCRTPIVDRNFGNWNMGLLDLDACGHLQRWMLSAFSELLVHARTSGDHDEARQLVVQLLRSFREQLSAQEIVNA